MAEHDMVKCINVTILSVGGGGEITMSFLLYMQFDHLLCMSDVCKSLFSSL